MVLLIIILGVCFLTVKFKSSKLLTFIVLLLAWLLIAFNYDNPDYDNYVIRFDNVSTWVGVATQGIMDAGFSLLMRLFYVLGVQDYYHFKLIISGISLLLFLLFSMKNVRYHAFWAFLYLVFYAILDVTQFRNFVAFSVVLALFPLLERNTFKSNILFLIGVLFATTIHFSMAFFLVMGLRLIKNERTRILLIAVLAIAVFVLRSSIWGSLQDTTYYNRVDDYARTSVLGALLTSTLFLCNYLIMHYFYLQSRKNAINNEKAVLVVQQSLSVANSFALYLLFLVPFVFINSMPVRILRFASLIEIGYLLNYAILIEKKKRSMVFLITLLLAVFFYFWTASNALDGLKYNYILDYLL